MKERCDGSMQSFKIKARQTIIPIVFSTALGITAPFNIDNNTSFEMKTNVAYAENETDSMRYQKLSSEYPRLYNPNYAISSKEAVQRDEKGHIIATNGVSITHKYNEDTGKWLKLEENLPYATPKVRIKHTLNSLLKMNYSLTNTDKANTEISNPLNIFEGDVERYLETKSDADTKSFKIVNNSKGEPSLVLATNPLSGIHEGNQSVNGILKAFDFLNKIDPEIVDKIAHQYYVRAIAGEVFDTNLRKQNFDSIPRASINTICLNGNNIKSNYIHAALSVLLQSRNVYFWKNTVFINGVSNTMVKDKYSEKLALDKFYWTSMWLNQNKSKMTKPEYDEMSSLLSRTTERFRKSNNL